MTFLHTGFSAVLNDNFFEPQNCKQSYVYVLVKKKRLSLIPKTDQRILFLAHFNNLSSCTFFQIYHSSCCCFDDKSRQQATWKIAQVSSTKKKKKVLNFIHTANDNCFILLKLFFVETSLYMINQISKYLGVLMNWDHN